MRLIVRIKKPPLICIKGGLYNIDKVRQNKIDLSVASLHRSDKGH